MTAADKEKIYRLLKTASDSIYGFSSPNFPEVMPDFSDDPEKELPVVTEQMSVSSSENSKLDGIARKISECNRCPLCKTRLNVVPGMGVEKPVVLVIGEGPGKEEDEQGLPFVGAAGQLLDKMLAAIQLSRATNTYITNIVKCRPPNNRNPEPNEADACRSFLDAQIIALKPKAILLAGSVAVKNLFHTGDGVLKLHGKSMEYNGIPCVTTYHPSALLRAPENKKIAWEDLKIFRSLLLEIAPDYAK